jgi:Holliday junction resolvasome RuvABC endonuclease subunit
MSQDDIHEIASKDTPEKVAVPNTLAGLVTWAVGRFGGTAVIAIAAAWAVVRIYTDMQVQTANQLGDQKAMNAQVIEMVRQATETSGETAQAMRELTKQVELNTRAVESRDK